jgi:hypothetical protein
MERERAVLAAFGAESPAKVVSMRAARYPCPWPACMAPIGERCTRPAAGKRRAWCSFPHPVRVAITEVCPEHGTAKGAVCPGWPADGCAAREAAVANLVALAPAVQKALSTAVKPPVDQWAEVLVAEDEQGPYPLSPRAVVKETTS